MDPSSLLALQISATQPFFVPVEPLLLQSALIGFGLAFLALLLHSVLPIERPFMRSTVQQFKRSRAVSVQKSTWQALADAGLDSVFIIWAWLLFAFLAFLALLMQEGSGTPVIVTLIAFFVVPALCIGMGLGAWRSTRWLLERRKGAEASL